MRNRSKVADDKKLVKNKRARRSELWETRASIDAIAMPREARRCHELCASQHAAIPNERAMRGACMQTGNLAGACAKKIN